MTKHIRWIVLGTFAAFILTSCFGTRKVELTINASSPQPSSAGPVIRIKYLIRNTGTRAISGPVNVTSDKTTVTCPTINAIGNLDNSLAPGEWIECTVDYPLSSVDITAGILTNTASATVGPVTSPPVTANLSTAPAPSPLKLSTSANPSTYGQAGQAITFTYVIQNIGAVNLGPTQFTLSDNLVQATSFNCGPADTTLVPNGTVTCTAPTPYITTPTDMTAVSVTNIATASGGGVPPSAAASTTINKSSTTLALTTSANPNTYSQAGQEITFTYVIQNTTTGNLGPTQFTVKDNLVNANPFNCGPASTTLTPGATVTCTAAYKVTQNDVTAVSITNLAAAFDGAGGSSPQASATLTKTTDGQHTVVKGEWLWQIARCYGVNPKTLIADNQSRVSNPRLLQPGTIVVIRNPGSYSKYYGPPCVETYTVKAGDSWESIAQAYSADPAILRMVNASKSLSAGTIVVVPKNSSSGSTAPIQTRALALTTSANPTTYTQAGQTITFNYVIRNSGNVTLGPAQFTVSDSLIAATPFSCGPGNTSLAANATVTCSATYTTTQNDMTAVSITNIATASGGGVGPSPSASAVIARQ